MSESEKPGDPKLPSTEQELLKLIALGDKGHKYSVEDFFRNPDKSGYKISPAGSYLSYMGPYERRQNLFVEDLANGAVRQITSETSRDIAGYAWVNPNRLVYVKDKAGDENFLLYAVNWDGSDAKELTPYEKVKIQIIDSLEDDDEAIIIGMNKDNPILFEPYRINIYTGDLEKLAENNNPMEPIDHWLTDHEGKLRIATKIVGGVNSCILYRDSEVEEFKEVITTDFKTTLLPLGFDEDNSHILYVSTNLGRDKCVISKYDMRLAKELGPLVFEHPEVDVQNIYWSRKKKKLTGIAYSTWKLQLKFFDDEWKSIYDQVQSQLGDYEVAISGKDRQENIWIFRSYSDRSLGAYFMYNKETGSFQKITDVSSWIDEEDMAHMKPVQYTTRDGLTIHAYISIPASNENLPLPFVVRPHGGPWVRDNWGYSSDVQLLASRGYGVFQMNYRGSTGYGKEFWTKSFKQWGKKMQDDITDGVHWLIEEGYADPERIAIYGGSYGGYATLAGIAFTPDLYKCAIDFVGVANLFTFMTTIPPYWKPYLDMFYEMVGHPEKDKELLEEGSPVFHTDKIKTPLFVVQGANDPRVNIDESDQIVRSLRERGIDVPYMVKYDEGHGFANEENRFEFFKAMVGFLEKHMNKNKSQSSSALPA